MRPEDLIESEFPPAAELPEELVAAEPKAEKKKLTVEEERKRLQERDRLVGQYLPFATYIVRKVSKTVSGSVDFEDLLSYAKVGLIEAAERFDARYKVDFRTFAFYRIRGAIYDGLRTTGWLSRTQFAKHQFEEASNNYLKSMSDRTAAGQTNFADSPVAEMEDTILNLASVYIMSLDAAEGLQIKDPNHKPADKKFELEQTRARVRNSIEKLPQKERQLIKLYYYGGMTLDEAGSSLGLSRSWTSRLHARALEQLLKIIREVADEGEFDDLDTVKSKSPDEDAKKAQGDKPAKGRTRSPRTAEDPNAAAARALVAGKRC